MRLAKRPLELVSEGPFGTFKGYGDDVSAQICLPRYCVGTIDQTGDSSTTLRMTVGPIIIRETHPSNLCQQVNSEEADAKVGQTFLSARLAILLRKT